jgi:hypothetical protein
MLQFNGAYIYGTHESVIHSPPTLQTVRTEFAGVIGESEIRLGRKARMLYAVIVLHNRYETSGALVNELERLDRLVGTHSQLIVSRGAWGGVPRTFRNCTFEGFAKDQSPDSGPLADQVGTLDGANPSWWVRGVLAWRQLKIGDE